MNARPIALALALLAAARPATAQVSDRGDGGAPSPVPAWMTLWSPLRPVATLNRTLPSAPAPPDLLAPAPRVGLLWSAGTAAGLGLDARDNYTALNVARSGASGTYRRPLDATDNSATQVDGLSWGPLGDHGAVIGHVTAAQGALDSAAFNDMAQPFGSDPFVVTDTAQPAMRAIAARLEGAIGGQFGGWTMGAAGGALVSSGHTLNSPFPRLTTFAAPGLSGGISRALPLDLRLAAFGRWAAGFETIRLPGQPQPGQANELSGYNEPDPVAITLQSLFNYRVNTSSWTGGLGLQGNFAGADWIVSADRTHRHSDHVHARGPNVPIDVWIASGWSYHAALQRQVLGLFATVTASYDQLNGNGIRADLPDGDIYRADEGAWEVLADLRWTSADSGWRVGVVGSVRRTHYKDTDFLAQVGSDVLSLTSGGGIAIARTLGNTAVAMGYSIGGYYASSALPDPKSMGPIYDRLTAPALELYGRAALPMSLGLTLRHTVAAHTALVLAAREYRVAASGASAVLTLVPAGSRTGSDIRFGVVMGQ